MKLLIFCLFIFTLNLVTTKKIGGWHISREIDVDGTGGGNWKVTFDDAVAAGVSLMRVYVHLPKETPNRTLTIASLNKLFESTRQAGGALIIRFFLRNRCRARVRRGRFPHHPKRFSHLRSDRSKQCGCYLCHSSRISRSRMGRMVGF